MSKPFNAEEAENFEDMEKQFAVTVVEQVETYWKLLESFKGSRLSLTAKDDEIYNHLLETFPDAKEDPEYFKVLNEEAFKSKGGKEVWRNFCNVYEKTVPDHNFGTMLRLESSDEYTEKNTMFSYRVQFYAIEIFRNRHGLNDWIHEKAKANK